MHRHPLIVSAVAAALVCLVSATAQADDVAGLGDVAVTQSVAKAPARHAFPSPPVDTTSKSPQTVAALRRLAEDAAKAHGLPTDYFIRLIAYESGFNQGAVSPAGAVGIAQFMPSTAQDRGLKDPFDPVEALPKSAAFLSDLNRQFGNLGLAAAAYNAGSKRVLEWLDGRSNLPIETRRYVYVVTGRFAEDWAPPGAPIAKGLDNSDITSPVTINRAALSGVSLKKNWELALLLSLTSNAAEKKAALDTAAALRNERKAGRRKARGLSGELSLCNTCIVQKVY
jgi:hypothetical protein